MYLVGQIKDNKLELTGDMQSGKGVCTKSMLLTQL